MASNRYGQIWHGKHHHLNIRFPSVDARKAYAEKFQNYHALHDHEGEAPRFELVSASAIPNWERTDDVDSLTIDGYSWNDIKSYHTEDYLTSRSQYRVPTCCVPPIIVLDSDFVDSGTLQRHELSSVFGDMPDADYASLLESVKRDGFMDPLIRVLDGKVLDGWHRYRAARELNLIRKLKFTKWDEDKEGDATAFVLARNIERRHLSASQRAQIAVAFNERFGHGGDRSKTPNGVLKTKKELAEQAKVGTSTIDRALAVEKAGGSEVVISGEKTASKVLDEQLESVRIRAQDAEVAMWDAFEKSELSEYLDKDDLQEVAAKNLQCPPHFPDPMQMRRPEIWICYFNAIKLTLEKESGWVQELLVEFREDVGMEESEPKSDDLDTLWEQVSAEITAWKKKREGVGYASKSMFTHATLRVLGLPLNSETNSDVLEKLLRLLTGKRTNILEVLIKRQLRGESLWTADDAAEVAKAPEAQTEETLSSLWEQVSAEIPEWKKRDKEFCPHPSVYIERASKDMLVEAFRLYKGETDVAGPATAKELKHLLKLMKKHDTIFVFKVRDVLKKAQQPVEESPAPLPDESETAGLIEVVPKPEPESIASAPDREGCEKDLTRTFSLQGTLNKSVVDLRRLSETYRISLEEVTKLKDHIWAVNLAEAHRLELWETFDNLEISKHLTHEEFATICCLQFNWMIVDDYDSPENYILGKDYALVKNLEGKAVMKQQQRFEKVTQSLKDEADWVKALLPETESSPAEEREFQYAILTGVTIWYNARAPVPNGVTEESTYIEFGDAIGNEDMGTGPENLLEALPLEVRQGLQKALEDV